MSGKPDFKVVALEVDVGKPHGPYDRCPECNAWKTKRAPKCRKCKTEAARRDRQEESVPLGYCEGRCGSRATERTEVDGVERAYCRRCHMEVDGRLDALRQRNTAGKKDPRPCDNCRRRVTTLRHGRCDRCRVYWNRHGVERPPVEGRVPQEPKPPKPCKVCRKLSKPLRRGVCHSCDSSARRGDAIRGFTLAHKGEGACRNCGATSNLHLHHVIPRSKWKAGRADLRNGIPLCATCHFGWHNKRVAIPRSALREEEIAFLLTAEIFEDVGEWLNRHYPTSIDEMERRDTP